MALIGNPLIQSAFVTDQFSGTGSQTAFTMSVAPANTASTLVAVSGVLQDPSTYSVSGTTLTFTGAPPSGTGNISVRYLGVPASSVVSTAYRTITEFTATAAQTTFSPPTYTAGFINVFRNGVRLGSADFTASNGTTVVLASGASAGDLVTTESYYVSSIVNGLPATGGTLGGQLTINAQTGQQPFIVQLNGTEYARVNSTGGLLVNTTTQTGTTRMVVADSSGNGQIRAIHSTGLGFQINQNSASGAVYLQQQDNADMAFATNNAEKMRLTSAGNVGIGTSSPAYKLDVQSSASDAVIRVKGTAGTLAGLVQADGNGTGSYPGFQLLQSGSAVWSMDLRGDTNLHFYRESGAGNVTIDSGSLGIGTAPSYVLDILNTNAIARLNSNSNSNGAQIILGTGVGTLTSQQSIYYDGSFQIAKAYSGTTLNIDSSGRVTMPNQPRFYAYSSASSMSSGNKVAFDTAPINVGSSFNTSTNTFTAPVAGTYYLVALLRYNQLGQTYTQTQIYINGGNTFQGHYNNTTNAASTYSGVPAPTMVYLSAGDTVNVYAVQSGGGTFTFSGLESSFFGWLVA